MKTDKQEQPINDKSHSRTETLTDLPVADEQADGARGGVDHQGRILVGNEGGLWR